MRKSCLLLLSVLVPTGLWADTITDPADLEAAMLSGVQTVAEPLQITDPYGPHFDFSGWVVNNRWYYFNPYRGDPFVRNECCASLMAPTQHAPEPASVLLLGAGLLALRRRLKRPSLKGAPLVLIA